MLAIGLRASCKLYQSLTSLVPFFNKLIDFISVLQSANSLDQRWFRMLPRTVNCKYTPFTPVSGPKGCSSLYLTCHWLGKFSCQFVLLFVGPRKLSISSHSKAPLFVYVCYWRSTPYLHASHHCPITPSRKPHPERLNVKVMLGDRLSEGISFHCWRTQVSFDWVLVIGSLVLSEDGLKLTM